MTIEN